MKVGDLVRVTSNSILWKEGDVGIILESVRSYSGGSFWILFNGRKRRMSALSFKVISKS